MHTRNFPLLGQLKANRKLIFISLALCLCLSFAAGLNWLQSVRANNAAQTLPFSQNWTNTGLITANDDWSGVAGIEGFLGDRAASGTTSDIDPQTIVEPLTTIDVVANQTNPNTNTAGGVAEFQATLQTTSNQTIALQGSGTADHPNIVLYLNTTGLTAINVSYNLRDIDCSVDNAQQQVALQYRVGASGNFTNLPTGYVSDATARVNGTAADVANCTLVTPVNVTLPVAAENQPQVQVRIITSNAAGSDEWVGVDDISVTGSMTMLPTNPTGVGLANPGTIVAGNSTLLTVSVTPGANPPSTGLAVTADLSTIGGSATQTFFDNGNNGDVTASDNVFSYNATTPVNTTPGAKTLPFSISDAQLRSGNGSISLTIQAPPPPSDHVVISQVYGGGGNSEATYQNDYIELYNPSMMTFNLTGWSVQYASATGSFGAPSTTTPLAGSIAPGEYYLVKLASGGMVGLALPPANVEGMTNMSASNGKVALVNNTEALTDGSSPCTLSDPNLVDFVGFGTANCREGTANAPAGSNTAAILRNSNGAADTNQNADDFTTGAPNPRRTATIIDAPPSVSSTDTDSDAFASTPAPRDASIAVFFSEPVEVTGTWYSLTCASSGAHTTVVAAGPQNWVITPDVNFTPGEQCTFQIFAANVKDLDTDDSVPNTDLMQADYTTTFTVTSDVPAPYTPSVHLTMGNPSGAVTDINQPNNYLLEKPELALSYNRDRGGPNWVSWHLSDDWTGSLTRVDTFRPDPQLPVAWNRVNQFDYSGSGFDRGHMTPSADRLASLPLNQATFLMDNIIPQAPDNNQGTWNNMEQALRTYTPANELYIVSGGAGTGGSGNNGFATTIAGGRITVPASTWKVALVIPKGENDIARVDCSARTIAVIVPNTNGTNPDWTTYLTTVDAVETLTGYDFFSNLPEPIQRCVEAGINGNNPPLDTDADGVPDSTDNCPFVMNANQANFDGDALGDVCDPDDDNDGVLDGDDQCPNTPLNTMVTSNGCPPVSAACPIISAVQGTAITPVTLSGTGGTGGPYTFSATGLPTGLMMSTGGTISGTPTVNGTFPYTVTVNDKDLNVGTVNCSVMVLCPTITLNPATLPNGVIGTAYNQSVVATPVGTTYSYGVTSGTLPTGLSLNDTTGAITGTPSVAGNFAFAITATGWGGCPKSQSYQIFIIGTCSPITLAPATLPNAVTNTAYPQTISATPAGSYSFAVTSGLLPAGLTLNANGSFSGAPIQSGVFNFRVTATGAVSCSGFRDYTLVVTCPTITVNPVSLPGGTVGTAYNQTVSASPAGSYNYAVSSGALPTGLTLNAATGALTGTPTTTGAFTFIVTASTGSCAGTRTYTVTIACPSVSFTTASLPAGQAGVAYSQTLNVTPVGSYTFSLVAGSLPTGLTLNTATGVISGMPSTTGTTTFTVKAQSSNGCSGTQNYTLVIGCPTIIVSPASLPSGSMGTAYSQALSVSPAGGNYSFAVTSGALPGGLALNPATGLLSGTPTANGSFTFTITATGFGSCSGSRSYTIVIGNGGCPTITLPALPNGSVGQLYNSSVAASPAGSYTYTATGSLPPGVTLFGAVGLLFGYPTTAGTYTFTITATAGACTGSQTYTVLIGAGFAALAQQGDYDGDGQADPTLWNAAQGRWEIVRSSDQQAQHEYWGTAGDVTLLGDYDGDGKTDLAVFRPGLSQGGTWYVKHSSDGSFLVKAWGLATDVPVPGDYDGDGKTDIAVWRGSNGTWYVVRSSDGVVEANTWGLSNAPYNDLAVPADYDGDGQTDLAVFRRATGTWLIRRSSDGRFRVQSWGVGTDVPVASDYDGDGKADLAVWRPSDGNWMILNSATNTSRVTAWGAAYAPYRDQSAPADYDGDGKTDIAVWRESEGRWYVLQSSDNAPRLVQQGQRGDKPLTPGQRN